MTTLEDKTRAIQRHVGVTGDGIYGDDMADALIAAFGIVVDEPRRHGLDDAVDFFKGVRAVTGPLVTLQVQTINGLLEAAAHWPAGMMAYGLATAWHEARFKPQEEWGKGRGKKYGKPGKYGQAPYGRGLVQLTWDHNYEWADKALGLDGALLKDFGLALRPDLSAAILVKGMETGAFNPKGKGLATYIDAVNPTRAEFVAARTTVNLNDKAGMIADLALRFLAALDAGGWG